LACGSPEPVRVEREGGEAKDTDWLNGYKKIRPIYMLSTRSPLQALRHI